MTSLTTTPETQLSAPASASAASLDPGHRPIPFTRLIGLELRKMFDTRSGFWMLAGIGILSIIATASLIVWGPESELDYESFASAVGIPMSVLLPMLAVLGVTSEWSQRSGLTTFTLVPARGRVIAAKFVATLLAGAAAMLLALAIGAVGNLVGSALAGVDVTWNVTLAEFSRIVLASEIGMLIGFTLGLVLRNSPAAIVGYFVYALVLPGLFSLLATFQEWFRDIRGWVDLNFSSTVLYDNAPTSTEWAHLGVSALIWLALPIAVGLLTLRRAEVK